MAQFIYQAKNNEQKPVKGTVEADSLDSAVAQVLGLGFVPVDIKPVTAERIRQSGAHKPPQSSPRVRREHVIFFIRQMSDLISAGVNVLRALTLTAQQIPNRSFKEIIQQMAGDVKDGSSLSQAMARYPKIFPRTYSSLIKAGESSGKLPEVFNRLADLSHRNWEARSQAIFAMVYPGLILTAGAATIAALIIWVVPKITTIFEELDQALPLPTTILLSVSDFFVRYWLLILLFFIAAGTAIFRVNQTPGGRLAIDRFKLKLPVIGRLIQGMEAGRFARTMSTLLGNGVSVTHALEVTAQGMENEVVRQEVLGFLQAVSHGASLNGALKRSSVFPESVSAMVAVGEESGALHQGLARMAEYFETQSQRIINTMTTLIEPVLILTLGLFVGMIVLAMLLPLLRMNTMIQ